MDPRSHDRAVVLFLGTILCRAPALGRHANGYCIGADPSCAPNTASPGWLQESARVSISNVGGVFGRNRNNWRPTIGLCSNHAHGIRGEGRRLLAYRRFTRNIEFRPSQSNPSGSSISKRVAASKSAKSIVVLSSTRSRAFEKASMAFNQRQIRANEIAFAASFNFRVVIDSH